MPKAIKVTQTNIVQILSKFPVDQEEVEDDYIGLYLVANFAATMPEGYLTAEELRRQWFTTGKKLENDWFEVLKRGVPLA